jgi:hypothetical protein
MYPKMQRLSNVKIGTAEPWIPLFDMEHGLQKKMQNFD